MNELNIDSIIGVAILEIITPNAIFQDQMNDPYSHLSLFTEVMKLRNTESGGSLAPIDGKYFYAQIIDNVLAFSSHR